MSNVENIQKTPDFHESIWNFRLASFWMKATPNIKNFICRAENWWKWSVRRGEQSDKVWGPETKVDTLQTNSQGVGHLSRPPLYITQGTCIHWCLRFLFYFLVQISSSKIASSIFLFAFDSELHTTSPLRTLICCSFCCHFLRVISDKVRPQILEGCTFGTYAARACKIYTIFASL